MSDSTSASVVRRGCRASCSRLAKRCLVSIIFSVSSSVDRNGSSLHLAVYRVFLQNFDICPPTWVDQAQTNVGERGHCLRGQPCPASVASQDNLDVKDTSAVLEHPHQSEGPRILERCYKEHIVSSVVCRGDTLGPKYHPKY